MSHPITIPIFGSSSGQQGSMQQQRHEDSGVDDVDWAQEMGHEAGGGGDQDMDFDLLAEYLLEDSHGQGGGPGMNFDFK